MLRDKNASIGTKRESSLHRSLKFRYSCEGSTEISIGDYVCDGLTSSGEIIEVQTGSFGPLKGKAAFLTQKGKLRIIHPIIMQKRIELYDIEGRLLHERKSPRKGSSWDLFKALIHAPELPLLRNLVIELAIIDVIEKRLDDGKGSWWRKGIRVSDRFLDVWHGSIILKKPKDYFKFIPFKKSEQFTARDLCKKAGINIALARKTLYVLSKMGLVERIGKQGKTLIYQAQKNGAVLEVIFLDSLFY
jgi:hypothetical protein